MERYSPYDGQERRHEENARLVERAYGKPELAVVYAPSKGL